MLLVTRGVGHEDMSRLLSYSPKLLEKQADFFSINKVQFYNK